MSRASMLAGAVLAATLAASAATTTGPAAAAVPPSPLLNLGTAAGSSPTAPPGHYRATLPGDGTKRYLRVSRAEGEGISIGVHAQPAPGGDSDNEELELALVLPDGTSCDSDSEAPSEYDIGLPMSLGVGLDATQSARATSSGTSDPKCLGATDLLLEVTREAPGRAPLPVELSVVREPRLAGASDQPSGAADLAPLQVALKDDARVVPGESPQTATVLGPDAGSTLDLTIGKPSYYKVRLGWNQRLAVAAQIPRNGGGYKVTNSLDATVQITAPSGRYARAGGQSQGSLYAGSTTEAETFTAYTAPVRWSNRNVTTVGSTTADIDGVRAMTQPGWYVVGLLIAPSDSDAGTVTGQVPATVTVRVTGTPAAGPVFTAAGGGELAAPPTGQLSGAGEEGGPNLLVRLGGSVLVVLLAAAAVLWALRARRRTSAAG